MSLKGLSKLITESLQGSDGRYSHSRVIAMLVAIAATIYMWKLVIMGGMTIDFFIAYLCYGTGHQTINKFLDFRSGNRSSNQNYQPNNQVQRNQVRYDSENPGYYQQTSYRYDDQQDGYDPNFDRPRNNRPMRDNRDGRFYGNSNGGYNNPQDYGPMRRTDDTNS